MNVSPALPLDQKVKAIFTRAITMDAPDREAYIRRQCAHDSALYDACQSLLAMHIEDASFFSQWQAEPVNPNGDLTGAVIGAYRIEQKLASGGMADIYRAVRADGVHYEPVVVKLIRGWGDSTELVARFERERKILASLKHPNIACFLDGGSTLEQRPYYVMEYVQGDHIDVYCNRRQAPLRERLGYINTICSALTRAHQSLIIHRDLKPANILVSNDGEVKLLDFGIAKLLQEEAGATDLSVLGNPMTPRYSSPEQLRHEALSTASDQYSLGVLMYELLTGRPPYDAALGQPLFSAICREMPEQPSRAVLQNSDLTLAERRKIHSQLRGDLDEIILKTLSKQAESRYPSVQDLADDIHRHLNNIPVTARKNSFFYSARRFVRRNAKAVSIAAVAATVTVLVGSAQQVRVLQERNSAISERQTAEHVLQFMIELFDTSDPANAQGNQVTAREILDKGVLKIEQELSDSPLERSRLLNKMGVIYRQLGLYKEAEKLLDRALRTRLAELSAGSLEVAESRVEYGLLKFEFGQYDQAEKYFTNALQTYEQSFESHGAQVAQLYSYLGSNYSEQGKYRQAIASHAQGLSLSLKLYGEGHRNNARFYSNLGVDYYRIGDLDRALDYDQKAIALLRKKSTGSDPSLARTLMNLGGVELAKWQYQSAIEHFNESLTIYLAVLGREHAEVARVYTNLGVAHFKLEQFDSAIQYYNDALTIYTNALGQHYPEIAAIYNNLGNVHDAMGQKQKSIEYYQKTLEMDIKSVGETHPYVAMSLTNLGQAFFDQKEYDVALDYYKKALSIYLDRYDKNHIAVARMYILLGELYAGLKQYNTALAYLQPALVTYNKTENRVNPNRAELFVLMGNVYLAQQKPSEALKYYLDAQTLFRDNLGDTHSKTREVTQKIHLVARS